MKTQHSKQGFVLVSVLALIVIASLAGGAFLLSSRQSFRSIERWSNYDECLLNAQAGIEQAKYEVDQMFQTNATASWDSLDILGNLNRTRQYVWTNNFTVVPYVATVTVQTVSAGVIKDTNTYNGIITITNTATAVHRGVTRRVQESVRYLFAAPPTPGLATGIGSVFDYAFFIDNHGLFSGVNADFNGDVRANRNISFQYSSIRLNGDSYASGENTSKKLYRSMAWSDYAAQTAPSGYKVADHCRPAEYTDFNRSNTNTYWPQGYDEKVNFYDGVEQIPMPFVGPLPEYEAYAKAVGGSIQQGGSNIVSAVWGDDPGENAGIGTNDTGCLVLVGTQANPIQLGGVIVARGDIYIKGYFTGQGTLYAGRNIHVIGNLTAVNPATWPHSDSNPRATATQNRTRDFLGLCAKGSLVFGDYSTLDTKYLKAPYTSTHATDPSDASLGYVSFTSNSIPYFNGNYTATDGGLRTDGSSRRFFEPTLEDDEFQSLLDSDWIGHFDALLYANHLISGEFDVNAVLNGGFVCRDEAVKRHGNLYINWDIRLGSRSYDGQNFGSWLPGTLPRLVSVYKTVSWRELAP